MEIDLSKQFARKVGIMLEARLIWYKHYFLFCDEVIEGLEKPPYWILELADKKYIGHAIKIANDYAYSEPFEIFPDTLHDFYIGCLFLRYERKELSWAVFLKEAGEYADGTKSVKHECEFFYYMLNDFEDSEYSTIVELSQKDIIRKSFKDEIHEVKNYYKPFLDYFRKYVSLHKSQS